MTDPQALHKAVLDWYDAHGRDLAFRRSSDPWAVFVSEVLAQQTQAARAAAAWESFIARYPTPAAFAATSPAEAIRAWRGLGYNRRAIALREAARRIVSEHDGRVPDDLDALQALPGIGPYTARAVFAIAFGRPVAALDTNIRRVLDRAMGGLPTSARERQAVADALVPTDRPAAWTHALMDIGATLCRAREVRCGACPLAAGCAFAREEERLAAVEARRTGEPLGRGGRSRRSPLAPATPFPSTNRWLRGRILDRLRDAPDGTWVAFDGAIGDHPPERVGSALAALAAQRMVEVDASSPLRARLPA